MERKAANRHMFLRMVGEAEILRDGFAFSSSFSTMFWFDKANRLSAISSFISCTNMALPQCFHGNFRIALYNLYLHSIHAFNKSGRHLECLMNDVIRGTISSAIIEL